jgi:adenylyltransferase/sulfurtransferase
MNDEQLLRYSRQILLPQIDIEGQESILNGHVVIIGLGGLGSPASLYLAAAGVGRITLIDDDHVELSNLQRQIVHTEARIGDLKVESAKAALTQLNREIEVVTIPKRLSKEELASVISQADVVLDCSDNFETRFMINAITQTKKIPLVSGAAIRFDGQVTVYDARKSGSACYQCIYQDNGEPLQTCSESGVLSPLLGIIGSMQAVEAIKLLTGVGETLSGRLMILDALSMSWREIRLRADPDCPICQNH